MFKRLVGPMWGIGGFQTVWIAPAKHIALDAGWKFTAKTVKPAELITTVPECGAKSLQAFCAMSRKISSDPLSKRQYK